MRGKLLFWRQQKEGILLLPLIGTYYLISEILSITEIQSITQRDFDNWFDSANEFFIHHTNVFKRGS